MHKIARNYIGLKVKSKTGDSVGTVRFSTFGVSIGGITEDGSHWHTLGMDDEEFFREWEELKDGNE